jgi:hypothetical protein
MTFSPRSSVRVEGDYRATPTVPTGLARLVAIVRFLHALNYCMLLPGPDAHQLAIYVRWLLNGRRGGIIAGTPVRSARHARTVGDLRCLR